MINDIMNFINENKEWIFSGIGITFITLVYKLIKKIFSGKKEKKEQIIIKQVNYGEKNTQIGIQNNYCKKDKSN